MFALTLLCLWAAADLSIKLYFNRQLRREEAELAAFRHSLLSFAASAQTSPCSVTAQQCLDCKRLRGHDDDCALDMSSLPPPSFAATDQRSDYYEDMP